MRGSLIAHQVGFTRGSGRRPSGGHRGRGSACPHDGRPGRGARGRPAGPRQPIRPSPRPRSSTTSRSAGTTTWTRSLRFADGCDVVTFDHEHVPPAHLEQLEAMRRGRAARAVGPVPRPGQDPHAAGADRHRHPVPAVAGRVGGSTTSRSSPRRSGWPVVLKTSRGGYDGRGVWVVDDRRPGRRRAGRPARPRVPSGWPRSGSTSCRSSPPRWRGHRTARRWPTRSCAPCRRTASARRSSRRRRDWRRRGRSRRRRSPCGSPATST